MSPAVAVSAAVAKEARRRALQQALRSLWVEDDFQQLWAVLLAHGRDELLDYHAFLRVREACVPLFGADRAHGLLRASVFCALPKRGGRVDATALFETLMSAAAWQHTCLQVRFKDGTGDGCLREHELQALLAELAPTLAGLQALPHSFAAKWARLACRALLFFCDRLQRGSVPIHVLLSSGAFSELLSLQGATPLWGAACGGHWLTPGADAAQGQSTANCFSARSALTTYKLFLEQDADKDGRLSAAEFRAGGGFTELFVERLFEVHVRSKPACGRSGLMDFDAFCDFQLAWRHRQHRASLAYFLRVLDVNARSSLGVEEVRRAARYVLGPPRPTSDCQSQQLSLFLREVQALWAESGHPAAVVGDVAAELFDMTCAKGRIMLRDLVESGTGGTVVGMLSSVTEFGKYDTREDARGLEAAVAAAAGLVAASCEAAAP